MFFILILRSNILRIIKNYSLIALENILVNDSYYIEINIPAQIHHNQSQKDKSLKNFAQNFH